MPENMIRAFLANAAATHHALSLGEPAELSVDYMNGRMAGHVAGELQGLAFALSCLTGESVTTLVEDACMGAQVDFQFPFTLHLSDGDGGL